MNLHHHYFILDENGEPKAVSNINDWAEWLESASTVLRHTRIGSGFVSTVFLAINYNFMGSGPPILWETMIFDLPELADYQRRYPSAKAALDGHALAVERAKEFFPLDCPVIEVDPSSFLQ